jgi:hypothetical protein
MSETPKAPDRVDRVLASAARYAAEDSLDGIAVVYVTKEGDLRFVFASRSGESIPLLAGLVRLTDAIVCASKPNDVPMDW